MRRNKVTTACEECRSRKKKCDGQRPRCQPCQDHNISCNWSDYSGRSTASTRKYVSQLESKVKELEQNQSHPNPITPSTTENTISPRDQNSSATISTEKHPPNATTYQPISDTIDCHLRKPKNSFGTASIGGFISQVVHDIDAENQPPEEIHPFGEDSVHKMTVKHKSSDPFTFGHALPPRKASDSLLSDYWKYNHPIFPFVDRMEIEAAYEQLWLANGNGKSLEEPIFLFILNILFAIAARTSPSVSPDQRAAASDLFLTRAQEAYTFDLWNAGCFQSVQALLLVGLYYHTNNPNQAWMAISMAVRVAQGLGLHLPETSEQLPSYHAREFSRRVWHGCVMMDRILSQTYGRPSMLSKRLAAAVPFPLPTEDSEQKGSASSLDFFTQSLVMYEILADIISYYYSDRQISVKGDVNDYESLFTLPSGRSLLSFENSLTQWFENLPPHLRIATAYSWGEIFTRQAVILQQRYLHIRILLLRPTLRSLAASLDAQQEHFGTFDPKKLHYSIMVQCAVTCVETAQEQISILETHAPSNVSDIGNVSAWMHNILFLYTAAIVLITARFCPLITLHIPQNSIAASWEAAMALLKRYEAYGQSAKRASIILNKLDQQVSADCIKRNGPRYDTGTDLSGNNTSETLPLITDAGYFMPNTDDANMSDGLGFIDLSPFNLEDFSWMDSMAFNM